VKEKTNSREKKGHPGNTASIGGLSKLQKGKKGRETGNSREERVVKEYQGKLDRKRETKNR